MSMDYKIPDEDTKALQMLFSNIQLIWKNKSLICANDDYYNICISGVGVCLPNLEIIRLFLGDLLLLWEQTAWKQDGEYCYFAMGWSSSKECTCHIWNTEKGFIKKSIKKFEDLADPAFSLLNHGQTDVISLKKPSTGKKFSSKLSIFNLIDELKK